MSPHTFMRAEKGGVAVLTAGAAIALIGAAGFAVDVGAVYLDARRLQGAADLAALAAVANPADAQARAEATLAANDWPDANVLATSGTYRNQREIPHADRFQTDAGATNAVRVDVRARTPLYFASLFVPEGAMTIERSATAAQRQVAAFQLGSRLLTLNGGAANAVLSGLTGSNVNLSVMDYNALLSTDVDLLAFADALRTRLDLEAASFDQTLNANVETGAVLSALAEVLGQSRAASAARTLAEAADRAGRDIEIGDVIDLGPYASQDQSPPETGSGIHVNAMDLASAVLQVAGGDRQVRLDLGAGVPGLTSTQIWLAIGERPNNSAWLAIGEDDHLTISTAQTRLYIQSTTSMPGLASLRIPLLVELAPAQARLEAIDCALSPSQHAVGVAVAPGAGAISLGEIDPTRLDNFRTPLNPTRAQLVRTALVRVDGRAHVEVGGEQWTELRFSQSDIDHGIIKSVATRDSARASISTLLQNTTLDVQASGLTLGVGAVTSLVSNTLRAAAAPLDHVLNGVLDLLGVRVGVADVRVNGVRCGGAALVA